jgi:dolichol-phosphate mannosyltransferase
MRFVRFNAVGGLGIVVQLTVIWFLTGVTQTPVALATALGVAAAVVNNFVWHRQWTWRDRLDDSGSTSAAFARFALANGMVSLIGNVAVMSALEQTTSLHPVPANLIAIGICGVANYFVGDRLVFRGEMNTG